MGAAIAVKSASAAVAPDDTTANGSVSIVLRQNFIVTSRFADASASASGNSSPTVALAVVGAVVGVLLVALVVLKKRANRRNR
jgi:hypothetical protein